MFVCCCSNLMMFYDWTECVMNVVAPRNIPRAIVLTLSNKVVLLYCIVISVVLAVS